MSSRSALVASVAFLVGLLVVLWRRPGTTERERDDALETRQPRLVLAFDGPSSPCVHDNPPFRLFRVRVTNTSPIEIRDVCVRLGLVPGHPAMSPPEFQVTNQPVGARTTTLGPGDTRYFDILLQHHPETGLGAVVWEFADRRIPQVQLDAYRRSYTFDLIVASPTVPPRSETFTVEFEERILGWRRS